MWMVKATRMGGTILVAMAVGMGLAGCENPRVGPIALQRDGRDLVVVVCAPIDATKLIFAERSSDPGSEWRRFWEATAKISLAAGDAISTSESVTPIEKAGARSRPEMSPGNYIDIEIDGDTAGSSRLAAQFSIGKDGLPQDRWLHPDGTITSKPCA